MAKDHTVCPGAKFMRQPKPEIFTCKNCGSEVEIWSDELRTECPHCHKFVVKTGNMSCLEWCAMGKECVGEDIYNKFMQNRALSIKDKLIAELEIYFGDDSKRINHAKKVLHYAEILLEKIGGDYHIVVPAGILHDIGIKIAEQRYDSSAGKYQEKEGPEIARKILLKLGLNMDGINEICDIIGHHHSPGKNESNNYKILYDADSTVNLKELSDKKSREELIDFIDRSFLTEEGKKLAENEYKQ